MSRENKNDLLKVRCFHCKGLITIKYVRASHNYSQKNNWGYWTEAPENEKLSLCDDCLVKLYKNHKWEFRRLIPKKKKQTLLRQYILNGTIKGQAEAIFIANKNSSICWLGENCPNLRKKK